MNSALELHEARLSFIDIGDGQATVGFSHAVIHESRGKAQGAAWSREARLILSNAVILTSLPALPAMVVDGYLEVGGIRHPSIPLPFRRKAGARLYLELAGGETINISGDRPEIELSDPPIFLGS